MARLSVNPTRMEFGRLKKRLVVAIRGHKLLKDKQDELMRQFIALIKYNNDLRKNVERKLQNVFKDFVMAKAVLGSEFLEEAIFYTTSKLTFDVGVKNVMSVKVPVFNFNRIKENEVNLSYGFFNTSSELDLSIMNLKMVFSELLELAEVEKSTQLMADEIEKTRRRVNALEYRTIPDLEETIKYIRMKLDENERGALTRLMKVKEIISKRSD